MNRFLILVSFSVVVFGFIIVLVVGDFMLVITADDLSTVLVLRLSGRWGTRKSSMQNRRS